MTSAFSSNDPIVKTKNSLGSGVIIRGDGIIVTNQHVIEGADRIRVVLSDKREFDAAIVAMDDKTDIAVLKIDPGDEVLPILELRDSDELKVGDLVLAIGNPFGVGANGDQRHCVGVGALYWGRGGV